MLPFPVHLPFSLAPSPESDGVVGTTVIAGQTVCAVPLPYGAPLRQGDVVKRTCFGAVATSGTGRRGAEMPVAGEKFVEQRAQDVTLAPWESAGNYIHNVRLATIDAARNLDQPWGKCLDFPFHHIRSVYVKAR